MMMELKLLLPKLFLPCVRIWLANVRLDSRVSKVGNENLWFSFCKERNFVDDLVGLSWFT